MLNITLFFLQSGEGGSSFGLFLPMILIFVIMYFLIFRPQAKKQKQHQKMVSELKKGDKVVTAGGIHGTIAGIKDKEQILIVEIDNNVKVRLSKNSVARVITKEQENAGS